VAGDSVATLGSIDGQGVHEIGGRIFSRLIGPIGSGRPGLFVIQLTNERRTLMDTLSHKITSTIAAMAVSQPLIGAIR
jgi:hypothetical protein